MNIYLWNSGNIWSFKLKESLFISITIYFPVTFTFQKDLWWEKEKGVEKQISNSKYSPNI